ncbi:hypothetical protein D7319_07965 [Streptomyces radicis]|uniref:Uncharacterized protein n=1 Tax=Streptomyces radicis TaxID=1750517 RepID=A0A3A9WFH3_9ACTN|nr:hypothetical protein D7319_07965 [Streptomyces radicis]RKN25306.1 hypothetical protein D7318_08820 [Streptomyces radicis]
MLVAVAVVGGGLFLTLGGDDDGGVSDDGKKYVLTAPETIADLSFMVEIPEAFSESDASDLGVEREGEAGGMYRSAGPTEPGVVGGIQYAGMYGTVDAPEEAVDLFFSSGAGTFTEGGTTQLTGSVESVSPEGLDNAVMKCQLLEVVEPVPGYTSTAPLCAWADFDTFAFVLVDRNTGGESDQVEEGLSIDAGADFAAQVREAVLQEVPGGDSGGERQLPGGEGDSGDSGGSSDDGVVELPWGENDSGGSGSYEEELPDIEIPGPSLDQGGASGEVFG